MQKLGVLLVLVLLFLSLNFVVAEEDFESNPDLDDCVNKCKINFEEEINRSPCIIECRSNYNLENSEKQEDFIDKRNGDCGDVNCDEIELTVGAGATPDSAFYFLDEFFDRFGNRIKIREEKIAEIKIMVQDGKIEEAKISLGNYLKEAEKLEKEVEPEQEQEAIISAAAIRNVVKEIRDEIPEEERELLVGEIIKKEESIIAAAEIAGKIKDLCVQLAGLDPVQYSKVCQIDDDAPKWKKRLNDDLTKEQKEEARKFGKIMSECFRTSGQECKCEEISFYDFSVACSKAAPLATACDIDGDDSACDELDRLKMPELPEHLHGILDDIEGEYIGGKYEMHMPKECVE